MTLVTSAEYRATIDVYFVWHSTWRTCRCDSDGEI